MSTATYQPDPNHPSFCQICGRAVANETDRLGGNAFHCGLCNEVRLASPASTGYGPTGVPVDAGAAPTAGASGAAGGVPPFTPFTPGPNPYAGAGSAPNPGLAALLGLIPGVGAMYNGQYAKGVVHLIVFAILVNLADAHDIFGLFVAGWIFYQAIEAHHTARARRDGTPLPNPFGLNDIGERFGFGKAWPSYPSSSNTTTGAAQEVSSAGAGAATDPRVAGAPYQAPATSNWGAPWESYRASAPPPPPPPPGYAASGSPYVPPPVPPFDPGVYAPVDPMGVGFEPRYPVARNRFPAGAIWLIALGTLFLLNTSGIFRGFNFRLFLPLFFLGLGIWTFVRKMTDMGYGLADDGSPAYRLRLFRAARGAVWLILLGVIFFLAEFNILSWGRSWPLFLILAGVMTFLERAVYSGAPAAGYGYAPPASPPYAQPGTTVETVSSPVASSTSAESTPTQEGR